MLLNKVIDYFGQLDILVIYNEFNNLIEHLNNQVNNAGVSSQPSKIETASMSNFDYVMNINVRTVYLLTQLAIPHLKKTKGNIVNVSSIGGTRVVSIEKKNNL